MMFYENLISINRQIGLDQETLHRLDDELTMVRPDDIVSPYYISRETHIELSTVKKFLIELAYNDSLGEMYAISCSNHDKEMIHSFEFHSLKELNDFIINNNRACPGCGTPLKVDETEVFFVRTNNSNYRG